MSAPNDHRFEIDRPRALIVGCAGTSLTEAERRLFRDFNPLGLILFQRNCRDSDQVRDLVDSFRALVERGDAPVLIDQEGGRVARLKPPHWRVSPPAEVFGKGFETDPDGARDAVWWNARLIAADLHDLGITVDCAPVLDLPQPDADGIIGDRAFAANPETIVDLARIACDGFVAGGVLPVIKHVPGHGRARVDSHKACPVVDTTGDELRRTDFHPFRELHAMPWAMTAHVVYTAFDPDHVATVSPIVVREVIRGWIGFEGVLVSDDLSMNALGGRLPDRALAALAAGCDVVLHCSGDLDEMTAIAEVCPPLGHLAALRLARAESMRRLPGPLDAVEAEERLESWVRKVSQT